MREFYAFEHLTFDESRARGALGRLLEDAALGRVFEALGFRAIARHRKKAVTLYRQGSINFLVNS